MEKNALDLLLQNRLYCLLLTPEQLNQVCLWAVSVQKRQTLISHYTHNRP
jgi:hypothetical protein